MIKTRWLWAFAGRYDLYRNRRELRVGLLFFPRPDLTPEGAYVAGWSFFFSMDWVDCSISLRRISYS